MKIGNIFVICVIFFIFWSVVGYILGFFVNSIQIEKFRRFEEITKYSNFIYSNNNVIYTNDFNKNSK